MDIKTIITIGLCLFIIGGLIFFQVKKYRGKDKNK